MNESIKEELLFGCMTYKEIMRLRAAYNLGIRTFETSQANFYTQDWCVKDGQKE